MPSLSQRYRPQRFADITGQAHVTETLRQEVASGVLGHAYLFSGPRGVGKTTAARVFAKALNCREPQNGEPCLACETCVAAQSGRLLDIIELDAATHTGVDMVRESIIEHVRFSPALGKRKIYILDEVHMFSTSSWNALLKTLEEPPAYAFFILATTEWHKVPATIISRCQRFEFRRIAEHDLLARLHALVRDERWQATDEALRLIAARASGCVRDAETLLGQLGALGQAVIDKNVVGLVIPSSHLPLAAGLMAHWARREHAAALNEVQRLSDEGIPLLPLFDDLLDIVRLLLIASADPGRVEFWKTGTEDDQALVPLVGVFSPGELSDMALLLMQRRHDAKSGIEPLFALQLASTVVANGLLRHTEHEFPTIPLGSSDPTHVSSRGTSVDQPSSLKGEWGSVPAASPTDVGTVEHLDRTGISVERTEEAGMSLHAIRAKWPAIIQAVDEKNHSIPFILKISQPERVTGSTVFIRFQYVFHRDKVVADSKHRRVVEDCVRQIMGDSRLTIEGIVGEDPKRTVERNQDMVSNILKAFGGTVVE